MPEGDTLFRTAHALHLALAGRELTTVESPLAAVTAAGLAGRTVERVEARGKNLLIHFDDQRALYTHLRMRGAWHLYRPGERWRKARHRLVVALANKSSVAACFEAPVVEILRAREIARHPVLGALGPDLSAEVFDREQALARLAALADTTVGEAIMDQRVMAGVGNVFKSEVLFIAAVSPFRCVGALDAATRERIVDVARTVLRRNRGKGPRTTRFASDGPRLWVYGRSGEPCLNCGAPIAMRRQGTLGRSTYYCPDCQQA
jgi:endonuclease VIII